MCRYCAMAVDGTQTNATLPCWRNLLAMQRVSAGAAKALLLCVVTRNASIEDSAEDSAATSELHARGLDAKAALMPEHIGSECPRNLNGATGTLAVSKFQVEIIEVSRWAPELNRST